MPFSDCRYLFPFRRYSRSKCEVVPKARQKACFSAPIFFGGGPQILDIVFKITPISDHVAKFRGDRPTDCGDLALNQKRKKINKETRKSCTGQAQCKVSAYAPSCRRCVSTYWKEQTRRSRKCKYLR